MQLGPTRLPTEPLSVFRFRYALFSFKFGIGFAVALAILVAIHPEVNRSSLPLVVMFLYIGLPIGLGMATLSSLGFFIGGAFAHWLEQSAGARWAWPRVKYAIGALISVPLSLFCLYWFLRGLTTMETLALLRHGAHVITPESNPLFFWLSVIGWGVLGFGTPISICRRGRVVFGA